MCCDGDYAELNKITAMGLYSCKRGERENAENDSKLEKTCPYMTRLDGYGTGTKRMQFVCLQFVCTENGGSDLMSTPNFKSWSRKLRFLTGTS